jgi:hypothetical protein
MIFILIAVKVTSQVSLIAAYGLFEIQLICLQINFQALSTKYSYISS